MQHAHGYIDGSCTLQIDQIARNPRVGLNIPRGEFNCVNWCYGFPKCCGVHRVVVIVIFCRHNVIRASIRICMRQRRRDIHAVEPLRLPIAVINDVVSCIIIRTDATTVLRRSSTADIHRRRSSLVHRGVVWISIGQGYAQHHPPFKRLHPRWRSGGKITINYPPPYINRTDKRIEHAPQRRAGSSGLATGFGLHTTSVKSAGR